MQKGVALLLMEYPSQYSGRGFHILVETAVMFPLRIVGNSFLLSALCASFFAEVKQPARDKSAVDEVIANIGEMRESLFRSNERLEGKIRRGGFSIAFRVALKSSYVEVSFAGSTGGFRIPVDETKVIQEFRDGHWIPSQSALTTPVAETVVSFEDIAFRFLFWPHPKRMGAGFVRTKSCEIVRFTAPANQSNYTFVEVWLEENSTAPLLAVCYGDDGQPVKRFDPVKFHRVGESWVAQSVRVTRLNEKTVNGGPTYIEFASLPDASSP